MRYDDMKILTKEYEKIVAEARDGYPGEICGLLLGTSKDGERITKTAFKARNTNTDRTHDRFELHPDDYLTADKLARDQGMEIIGIYHSHPDHPAEPSAFDRELAWEGFSYLIMRVSNGTDLEARSWFLEDQEGEFEEEKLVIE